ncbi:MAG TPA: hypothetical protein VK794_07315 [Steroidobacteraceae bacterium]|jgi:hypothetical protein|nr:hypothetical protein [Steroidobacteraceae bacterium]
MRALISKLLALPMGAALLIMAACSGSAVVTLTATPSSDPFIVYQVGLASVQLTKSGGKSGLAILPAETTVDFTKLFDLTEVLGAPGVPKGTYTSAFITLDYSAAQIIYDDGSLDGVALAPVDAKGNPLTTISVSVTLDPADPFRSAAKQVALVALNFNLAASNAVNLSARTVTVTPLISASTLPIDTKPARIRGPLMSTNAAFFTTGVTPFDGTTAGLGTLSIDPSSTTAYDINGFVAVGAAGQVQLEAVPANSLVQTFGTLTVTTPTTASALTTTPTTTTPATTTTTTTTNIYASPTTATSSVSFAATQVLVDIGAQGLDGVGDQISGIVSARSGDTVGVEDATLIQSGGTVTFVPGTTIVNLGPNTLITVFGQTVAEVISPQQISVGSSIQAFGTESPTTASTGGVLLDASAGRVRLDPTTAEGLVTAQSNAALTLNLTSLGGRLISAFDFTGSGNVAANQYAVSAPPPLSLANVSVGAPVVVTGLPSAFGTASPDFTASTLLDPTTIDAELVVDWSGGNAAPFTTFDSTAIAVNVNSSFGARHQIQIGSQIVNIAGLSPALTISPTGASAMQFSIGHSVSFTIESFDTYGAFIAQLQTELNGSTLATGMTAVGQYTVSTAAFSAASITVFLDN